MIIDSKGEHAILGALVADAASLGLHWLYDQSRILALEPDVPEFHEPSASDLADTPGYFAHAKKRAGDLSQYGEQVLVMLRTLHAGQGKYDLARYQSIFCDYFGYGGDYVGYIDRATRDTLDNTASMQREAIERTNALPFDGNNEVKQRLISKLLACTKQFSGEELQRQLEMSVRITDDSDTNVAHAMQMLKEWQSTTDYPGSEDTQLPAIAKLPPLVARYAGKPELVEFAESAIRMTNNNQTSVDYGLAATELMETAILTGDIEQVCTVAEHTDNDAVRVLLTEALSLREQSNAKVTQHFGLSCNLSYGMPSVLHNLCSTDNFTQAIRRNVYAGGDSCGRAILLGAVLGACFGIGGSSGIPQAWLEKMSVYEDAVRLWT